VLVATSIGEEGLDIPSVDNVIFFEPVPSEIRTIQRRGRAGRSKLGRMFGLIARKTRDQAFFWSSKRKEEKMKKIVSAMSSKTTGTKQVEQNIVKPNFCIKKDVKDADENSEIPDLKKTDEKDDLKNIDICEEDLDHIKNDDKNTSKQKEVRRKEQEIGLPKTKYTKRTAKQTKLLDF
jgi:Fanconi anemia group M protein